MVSIIQEEVKLNWIDISIIIISGLGLFTGWKIGLLGITFTSIGILMAAIFAGSLNNHLEPIINDLISNDLFSIWISYIIIFASVFGISQACKSLFKNLLKMVFLGWIDTLGSVILGIIMATVLSSTVISVLSKYSHELIVQPSNENPNIGIIIMDGTGIPKTVNDALVESTLVPVLLDIRKAIPGHILSFIPGDFNESLTILEKQIEDK
tara:strand:- start:16 stop:645 length:630 start_codon:yes stop_codon:yes gene_type:complete